MKLKILLLAVFAAGLSASLAFAEDGKPKAKKPACTPVHLEGTIAPQSLTMTVTKGSEGAVAEQIRKLGGEEADPWEELRALQAGLPGRVRWDGQDAPLVRPGRRVAYVEEAVEPVWSPLAERVREALCSPS